MASPRVNSIVTTTDKFREETTFWPDFIPDYGYNPKFLFLGEIPNSPERCIVIWLSKENTTLISLTEYFRECTEGEVNRD